MAIILWSAGNGIQGESALSEEYKPKEESMLLVLAAPSVHDRYYREHFQDIVDFQIDYAHKIIGTDDVRILVDRDTRRYYQGRVPNSVLMDANMYDIWIRDFATVNPQAPIQFTYTHASMSPAESRKTQARFDAFADMYEIQRKRSDYILDGGNIVDNYRGRIVTTTRFLRDNNLEYDEGKSALAHTLSAREVAIIEPDDMQLAHADGMVAWIDDDTLLVNDYSAQDSVFHRAVIRELRRSFPDTTILPVPVTFESGGADTTKGIGSACGIHLNLVATYRALYVPIFHTAREREVLKIIQSNTTKKIVTVDARNICAFGGSVRCTTWQLAGRNANIFIGKSTPTDKNHR